jgi:hypothetical protein
MSTLISTACNADLERPQPTMEQRLAKWIESPFSVAWLGLSSNRRAKGVLILCLDSEFIRIKFDRVFDTPGQYFLVGAPSQALTSVRLDGETRARQDSPKSVVQLIRWLLDRPPELCVQDRLELFDAGLSARSDCAERLTGHLIGKHFGAPGQWVDSLLRFLVGPVAAELLRELWANGTIQQTRMLGRFLANQAGFSAYYRKLQDHRRTNFLPILSLDPDTDPIDEIHRLVGEKAPVLGHLPAEWIRRIHMLSASEQSERYRYYQMLASELRLCRTTLEKLPAGDQLRLIDFLARLSQRRSVIAMTAERGLWWPKPQIMQLGIRAHTATPMLGTSMSGVSAPAIEVILIKFLAKLRQTSALPDLLDEIHEQLDLVLRWCGFEKPTTENLRRLTQPQLHRRAARWERESAEGSAWPVATIEVDGGMRFAPLKSDLMLIEAGKRFENCLRRTGREAYRQASLMGTTRLFEIHDGGVAVAILALAWQSTSNKWTVSEAKGVANATLGARVHKAAHAFALAFTHAQPKPFPQILDQASS